MSVITLFCGSYCSGEDIACEVARRLGYRSLDDRELIAMTADRFRIDDTKLFKALSGKTSLFNKFTHERERSLAYLNVTLADLLKEDNLLFLGLAGHMIPREISHALRVCVVAELKYRAAEAGAKLGLSEKDALKRILKDDESLVLWVDYLFKHNDPWAAELYDIVIPIDKSTMERAVELICENVRKDVLKVTSASLKAIDDFILASRVNLKLAEAGHDVLASAKNGYVTVTINKHVLVLSSLEEELRRIVYSVPGVNGVEAKVGKGYYQTDIYRRYDFSLPLPSKVLLVDDEREFAQSLSERLQLRDLGSAVVFDGETAIEAVEEEEPEVMVLDLKMPGLDGVEVLRRVRSEHPNVQVIVLTGHGSEETRRQCMELGACAYFEKPVDIEKLTAAMKEAYEKLKGK
jgi:two-component system response regulator CpxR